MHVIVYTKHFARSIPFPVATIDIADPDYVDILSSIKIDEFNKAKQEGRTRPIITVVTVDHGVVIPNIPPVAVPPVPPLIPQGLLSPDGSPMGGDSLNPRAFDSEGRRVNEVPLYLQNQN